MTSLLELVATAKASGNIASLADTMPYVRFMGMAPENSTGELLTRMRFGAQLIGNPVLPALHGGTIGALLESAAIFQLIWESDTVAIPKIITITVDYLRSGRPVDTLARATVTKQGRRVVNVAVEAWQEDRARPIASANAHFLITPPETPGRAPTA
jgi:acyl-coenzyme A thioesterase PaaI-like protein